MFFVKKAVLTWFLPSFLGQKIGFLLGGVFTHTTFFDYQAFWFKNGFWIGMICVLRIKGFSAHFWGFHLLSSRSHF